MLYYVIVKWYISSKECNSPFTFPINHIVENEIMSWNSFVVTCWVVAVVLFLSCWPSAIGVVALIFVSANIPSFRCNVLQFEHVHVASWIEANISESILLLPQSLFCDDDHHHHHHQTRYLSFRGNRVTISRWRQICVEKCFQWGSCLVRLLDGYIWTVNEIGITLLQVRSWRDSKWQSFNYTKYSIP